MMHTTSARRTLPCGCKINGRLIDDYCPEAERLASLANNCNRATPLCRERGQQAGLDLIAHFKEGLAAHAN